MAMTPRNIVVEEIKQTSIEAREVEIVERKGLGHPDSIADGIAEAVSRALCKMYIERFGRILHHNTDECSVVGGQSAPKFGGGVVLEPAYILLTGRATTEVNNERLPYRSVAVRAAHDYLEQTCKHLDVDANVILDCRIGKGSVDLRELYETGRRLANDTSFGVGFAPYSETETIVLETERYINSWLKKRLPEVGEDIKVMGYRRGDKIKLTVAAAIIDSEVPDEDHYRNVVDELREKIYDHAIKYTKREVEVAVNTADDYERKIFYLTVTGLSWENGDDGSVGRGNRVCGLITPCRPMSLEASAGKNPVTHVGKMYNLLAYNMAHEIYKEAGGDAIEVHVRLLSQIGSPIDQPQISSVQLIMNNNANFSRIKSDAEAIVNRWLDKIYTITDMILEGKVDVF